MELGMFAVQIPEGEERENGYVVMKHGTQYSIALTNFYGTQCDAEIHIDGQHVGTWRVPSLSKVSIERPVFDTGRFTFYQVGSREAQAAEISKGDNTGLIVVIFKPEFKSNQWSADGVSGMKSGGTGLSGQSKQEFRTVAPLVYDHKNQITINLRLVAETNTPRPLRPRSTTIPPAVE